MLLIWKSVVERRLFIKHFGQSIVVFRHTVLAWEIRKHFLDKMRSSPSRLTPHMPQEAWILFSIQLFFQRNV